MSKEIAPEILIRDFRKEDFQEVLDIWKNTNLNDPERSDGMEVIESTLNRGFLLKG